MPRLLILIISYALGSFITRLASALGIGIFTYKGLEALIDRAIDFIVQWSANVPEAILNIVVIAGLPDALTIICSALLTRAAINSARSFIGVVA